MIDPTISLRPALPEDQPFLLQVYRSSREPELQLTTWDESQKAAFVLQQFNGQDQHYREYYPNAEFLIVERDGVRVGRLYIERWSKEIRVMDIALLPEFRGMRVGTKLIRDLQAEALNLGKKVSLHVEKWNPALQWYDRLGFKPIEDKGINYLLEWTGERMSDEG